MRLVKRLLSGLKTSVPILVFSASGCVLSFVNSLTNAEKSADESAYNSRAKRHPAIVMATVMVVNVMVYVVMFGGWMMMFLGCVMFFCRRTLYCLMSRGGFWRATFTSVRSSHHGTAESYAGKSENHKFFKSLVHITPSLSFFVLMRTNFAAYNSLGVVCFVF